MEQGEEPWISEGEIQRPFCPGKWWGGGGGESGMQESMQTVAQLRGVGSIFTLVLWELLYLENTEPSPG